MATAGTYFDTLLFAVLPYVALFMFFFGTVWRYRQQSFTYSSLSSQFLENQQHFWAVVPFHFGILFVLTGHVVAFLFPAQILAWNSQPLRLYILEISALCGGLMSLVGLLAVLVRRAGNSKVRRVTTATDWLVYILLLVQFCSGVWMALFVPWGSSWFAGAMAPYLWSIAKLNPLLETVVGSPWIVKLHLINAWVVIGLFPFTRLVHILVIPNMYLWRKAQVVRWWRPLPSRRAA